MGEVTCLLMFVEMHNVEVRVSDTLFQLTLIIAAYKYQIYDSVSTVSRIGL